jgi:hypothetical protein
MTSIPGMIYPTQQGMLAGNPRDSAIAQMTNMNTKQAALSNSVGGRKRKKGGNIPVPQYNMLYHSQNGIGTDPNSQIQINSQISTQGAANRVYDNQATIMGGTRRRKRRFSRYGGNNSNWHWNCSSGGRKHYMTRHKKKRKTKRRN